MIRLFRAVLLGCALVGTFGAWAEKSPKYVFVFIGDGMSTPQRCVAEKFSEKSGRGPLAMNRLASIADTRTRSANAVVTDSAAAGTAIACGEKTNNGMVGVRPDGSRVESVAEVAKRLGRRVGIVTTVTVVHATPACFYAHQRNRGAAYRIGLDLIASGFDYFAASGVYDKYDDRSDSAYRGELTALARTAGYTVNRNDRAAWAALKPHSRSWNIFGDRGMQFAIDADGSEPTLADLVAKGVEVMDGPEGFFMMCEGGKVDYACHANDAATSLRDVLALDDAVKVALAFAARHADETLIITTGDHETGGLTMGFAGMGGRFRVELLAGQKISVERYSGQVKRFIREKKGAVTLDDLKPELKALFGLDDFTPSEVKTLEAALAKDIGMVRRKTKDTTAHDVKRRYVFAQAVKNVLNARAGVGWACGSHTAAPTRTTADGCGAARFAGLTENTEIARTLKALLESGDK